MTFPLVMKRSWVGAGRGCRSPAALGMKLKMKLKYWSCRGGGAVGRCPYLRPCRPCHHCSSVDGPTFIYFFSIKFLLLPNLLFEI